MLCTVECVHTAVLHGFKLFLNFYRYISHAYSDGWMRNRRATQQWKSIVLSVGWSILSPSLTWVSKFISVRVVAWLVILVISSTQIFMQVQYLHIKKHYITSVLPFRTNTIKLKRVHTVSNTDRFSKVAYWKVLYCTMQRKPYITIYFSVGIYILIPMTGQLMLFLDRVDAFIYKVCPFVAAGVVVGSIYWTAVTYGAITVMQVMY